MRVTNMMTSSQLLLNLNKSMNSLSMLQYQMETGNKIRFASDDPIIAGRSLKFRTNIVESNQYLSNVDQGRSWLQTTATTIKNVMDALSDTGENSIRNLAVNAANNGILTISDAQVYANQIRETLNEILGELNSTYAGRYIFSGYKTDECPVFDVDKPGTQMIINQGFSYDDIQAGYKVYVKDNASAMPREVSCNRIKLAYDVGISDIKGLIPTPVTKKSSDLGAYEPDPGEIYFLEDTGELIFADDVYQEIKINIDTNVPAANAATSAALDALQSMDKTNTELGAISARDAAQNALDEIDALIALAGAGTAIDTDSYGKLTTARDAANNSLTAAQALVDAYAASATDKELQNLRYEARQASEKSYSLALIASKTTQSVEITYTKIGFKLGDINPKVYFSCTDTATQMKYNMDSQTIMYEFGTNNRMQVNSLAKDILTPRLLNDILDVVKLVEGVRLSDYDSVVDAIKVLDPSLSDEEVKALADEQITNENKFYMDMIADKFTKLIGNMDNHLTNVSVQNTAVGSRLQRLDLISNRLSDDLLNFQDLKSQNDSVDAADVYVKYSSMMSVYQSALQTGAKVIQMSLVNFI